MKIGQTIALVAVVGVLLVAAIFGTLKWGGSLSSADKDSSPVGGGTLVQPPNGDELAAICPDDLDTVLTLTAQNKLNTTGREEYDNTVMVYKVQNGEESYFAAMSDSTAGTQTVDCGEIYRIRVVATDASNGDSGKILGVSGKNAKLSEDGKYVEFLASGSTYPLTIQTKQHGVLQFRVKDNINDGLMYDAADAAQDATDFELTGATFTSTVGNTTALAVAAGGDLDLDVQVKTTEGDVDYIDFSGLVLIDAASSVWDDAEVSFGGSVLPKATLDDFENRLWGGTYEQKFLLSGEIRESQKTVNIKISALDGVNPGASDNIVVAIASSGASRETSGNGVRYAAATDASSPAAVYTIQSLTIDVS